MKRIDRSFDAEGKSKMETNQREMWKIDRDYRERELIEVLRVKKQRVMCACV